MHLCCARCSTASATTALQLLLSTTAMMMMMMMMMQQPAALALDNGLCITPPMGYNVCHCCTLSLLVEQLMMTTME
jgi:hypothetical protein